MAANGVPKYVRGYFRKNINQLLRTQNYIGSNMQY
jgi:hypothetical protein